MLLDNEDEPLALRSHMLHAFELWMISLSCLSIRNGLDD